LIFSPKKNRMSLMGTPERNQTRNLLKENYPVNSPIPKVPEEELTSPQKRKRSMKEAITSIWKKRKGENRTLFPKKVFVEPLDQLMEYQKILIPNLDIPLFLRQAIDILLIHGINEIHIFRMSPSLTLLNERKSEVDAGKELKYDPKTCDCHVVAGLFKSLLRDLPECILTEALYQPILDTANESNPEKLKKLLAKLPPNNRAVCKEVFQLLSIVKDNESVNCMSAENLAITNGPNILFTKPEASRMEATFSINDVVKTIILNFHYLFPESGGDSKKDIQTLEQLRRSVTLVPQDSEFRELEPNPELTKATKKPQKHEKQIEFEGISLNEALEAFFPV